MMTYHIQSAQDWCVAYSVVRKDIKSPFVNATSSAVNPKKQVKRNMWYSDFLRGVCVCVCVDSSLYCPCKNIEGDGQLKLTYSDGRNAWWLSGTKLVGGVMGAAKK